MPANRTVPMPAQGESLIIWSARYGRPAIEQLNALVLAELRLSQPKSTRTRDAFIMAGSSALMDLQFRFTVPVAAPSGGATVDTECRAQLTKLLTRLQEIGFNA